MVIKTDRITIVHLAEDPDWMFADWFSASAADFVSFDISAFDLSADHLHIQSTASLQEINQPSNAYSDLQHDLPYDVLTLKPTLDATSDTRWYGIPRLSNPRPFMPMTVLWMAHPT